MQVTKEGDSMEYNRPNDELLHYGVLGMKWGVHRASKRLSNATSDDAKRKAVQKLETHKAKATKKINKLANEHAKLEKKRDTYAKREDIKAAKLKRKATELNRKAYTGLRTKERRQELKFKSEILNAKADELIAQSNTVKAKISKNETLTKQFQKGINDIDQVLVDHGRRFVNGK